MILRGSRRHRHLISEVPDDTRAPLEISLKPLTLAIRADCLNLGRRQRSRALFHAWAPAEAQRQCKQSLIGAVERARRADVGGLREIFRGEQETLRSIVA